jgi:hypothetical protein
VSVRCNELASYRRFERGVQREDHPCAENGQILIVWSADIQGPSVSRAILFSLFSGQIPASRAYYDWASDSAERVCPFLFEFRHLVLVAGRSVCRTVNYCSPAVLPNTYFNILLLSGIKGGVGIMYLMHWPNAKRQYFKILEYATQPPTSNSHVSLSCAPTKGILTIPKGLQILASLKTNGV